MIQDECQICKDIGGQNSIEILKLKNKHLIIISKAFIHDRKNNKGKLVFSIYSYMMNDDF